MSGTATKLINPPKDPGMAGQVLARMEQAFAADLAAVTPRGDAGGTPGAGAVAYAQGDGILFTDGRYAPSSQDGRHLAAHEAAHVMQQGSAGGWR